MWIHHSGSMIHFVHLRFTIHKTVIFCPNSHGGHIISSDRDHACFPWTISTVMWNWHHHGFSSFSVNNSFIKLGWWSSTAIAFSEEVTFNLYLFWLSHDIRSILAEECPIGSQPWQADSPLRHIALIKVLIILRAELSSIAALLCSKHLGAGVIDHVRCLVVVYTLVSVMKCSGISKGLLTIPLISEVSLTLVSHSLHQALSLDGAQVSLELLTLDELRCLTH